MDELELQTKLEKFDWFGVTIPEHGKDGLLLYVTRGIPPGNFLTAVLSNDLKEACARADQENAFALQAYVGFLYNHCPASCWGSKEKVNAWIDSHRRM